MLNKVKTALRITNNKFDEQISDLIQSAIKDLGIVAEVVNPKDALVREAIITYCRLHFGQPDDYDRLERSYWEQKAQLRANPNYKESANG
jgi:hypothetical protein